MDYITKQGQAIDFVQRYIDPQSKNKGWKSIKQIESEHKLALLTIQKPKQNYSKKTIYK